MTSRQKKHAAKMRKRRHEAPARPWDFRKAEHEERFRLSLRKLIAAGLSDAVIAKRLGLPDKQVLCILRDARCLKSRR